MLPVDSQIESWRPFVGTLEKVRQFNREHPGFVVGQDVGIVASGEILEADDYSVVVPALVPKGYFASFGASIEDEPDFIRYCLGFSYISARSKVFAQPGIDICSTMSANPTFEQLPCTLVHQNKQDYWKTNVMLVNRNPTRKYKLPKSDNFPAFRLYIPPIGCLMGRELVQMTEGLVVDPGLLELNGFQDRKVYHQTEINGWARNDPRLEPGQVGSLSDIGLPLVRHAVFEGPVRTIELQALAQAKTRAQVDELLGLRWGYQPELNSGGVDNYVLSETPRVRVLANIILELVGGIQDLGHTGIRHLWSCIIDPGFGQPEGSAIRIEHQVMGKNAKVSESARVYFHAYRV